MVDEKREKYRFIDTVIVKNPVRDDIDPKLLPLFDYWTEKRAGRPLLDKADVDPLRLPAAILPHLILIEILRNPLDFRFLVIGTHICDFLGRDSTGRRISELSYTEPHGKMIWHLYSTVAEESVPVAEQGRALWIGKDHLETRTFYVPVTRDGATTGLIFGGISARFFSRQG